MTHPRVVLITGASSGIGRAVAHRAASAGDNVILAARGATALEETARECEAAGARSVMVSPIDVGDDDAVGSCVRTIVAEHGRIDAIIHCAGVVAFGRTEDIPVDVFDRVLVTNVIGSVNVARHAISRFREQDHGSLVLMGSVIGHAAAPRMTPYAVSKWGVRALARQLQIENRDKPDVAISYVAPGMVDTPIWRQAANYTGQEASPPPPVASPEQVAGSCGDASSIPGPVPRPVSPTTSYASASPRCPGSSTCSPDRCSALASLTAVTRSPQARATFSPPARRRIAYEGTMGARW